VDRTVHDLEAGTHQHGLQEPGEGAVLDKQAFAGDGHLDTEDVAAYDRKQGTAPDEAAESNRLAVSAPPTKVWSGGSAPVLRPLYRGMVAPDRGSP
jgi:hypothetical protein